jgi:hypothetical protein
VSPYIVTTKRPPKPPSRTSHTVHGAHSRRAVATLEEARQAVLLSIHDHAVWSEWEEYVNTLSAGTIGPFPDGTIVQVERVDWPDLAVQSASANPTNHEKSRLIDAFNAREATR